MQNWSNTSDKQTRIAFLLFERFSNLCLANCVEPLRAANDFAESRAFEWKFYTIEGTPVHSSSNLPVIPHKAVHDLEPCDYLFILASYDFKLHDTALVRKTLWRVAQSCKILVGLDTAPWLMAASGLLDGRRATVHWDILNEFSENFLSLEAVKDRTVWDGNRITCAGAMSAFDLTRDIIRKHLGNAMALDVDALFLRDTPEAPTPRRYAPHKSTPVQKALALMQNHIETPLSLREISQRIACPQKTLARKFQTTMGATPGQVYRHLRLTQARHFLETTSLNINEVAFRCGYESPAALTRAYKARFGKVPRDVKHRATRETP